MSQKTVEQIPQLYYFFDPMCSWCWGFSPHLERLHQEYAGRITINMVVGGLRSETQPLTPEKREYILGHWRNVSQSSGQPFDFERALPAGFIYDTEPVCRAAVVFRESYQEVLTGFVSRVQETFYTAGLDVTNSEVLADLAVEQGMDRQQFLHLHASERFRALTQLDFEKTAGIGVQGFPTLALQGPQGWIVICQGYLDWELLDRRLASQLSQL